MSDTPYPVAVATPYPGPLPQGAAAADSPDQQRQLRMLEEMHPAEHVALRESGSLPAYQDAIRSVCLHCSITPTPVQIRAICLRLQANGISPKRVKRIAEILIDSAEFDDKVKRFRGEMTPGDWIRINDLFPVRGRHYSAREVETMTAVLRIDSALFPRTNANEDDRAPAFMFVPGAKAALLAAAAGTDEGAE